MGDIVSGTALVKLRKQALIHQFDAELIGCTEYRRQLQAGAPMTFEEVQFRDGVTLDFHYEPWRMEYSVDFAFSTDGDGFEKWVYVSSPVRWYIRVSLKCKGIDLESRRYFDLFSPNEFPDLQELLKSN